MGGLEKKNLLPRQFPSWLSPGKKRKGEREGEGERGVASFNLGLASCSVMVCVVWYVKQKKSRSMEELVGGKKRTTVARLQGSTTCNECPMSGWITGTRKTAEMEAADKSRKTEFN